MARRTALILAVVAGSLLIGCGSNSGTVGVSGPANGACVDCGPADLVVPNVVGETLLDADRTLSNAHLLCRSTALVDAEPIGTIISQDPKAGSKVRQYITVSVSYAVTKTTPPAVGNGCALGFSTVP
jgi:beta-lactam-binding protein with PASTA domain